MVWCALLCEVFARGNKYWSSEQGALGRPEGLRCDAESSRAAGCVSVAVPRASSGRGRGALVPLASKLLFAVRHRKRTCRRHRALHYLHSVHLWPRKYLSWCEKPFLVQPTIGFLNFVFVQTCLLCAKFCTVRLVISTFLRVLKTHCMFWSIRIRISATAKASAPKVGWTPASPVLRWGKISIWKNLLVFLWT